MRIKKLLSCAALAVFMLVASEKPASSQTKSDKIKQRMEQLFLWRVSDRLQLTTQEENIFQVEFKKLSEEKQRLTMDSENLMDQIEQNKSDKKNAQQLMKQYLSAVEKLSAQTVKEVQKIEKLFGSQRAAEYVLLKREMTQKFKDALTQDRSQASAN